MKITLGFLQSLPGNTIFAAGLFTNTIDANITEERRLLQFAAVRGGIPDWTVYVGLTTARIEDVARSGDKISRVSALRLVDVDDAVKALYRE